MAAQKDSKIDSKSGLSGLGNASGAMALAMDDMFRPKTEPGTLRHVHAAAPLLKPSGPIDVDGIDSSAAKPEVRLSAHLVMYRADKSEFPKGLFEAAPRGAFKKLKAAVYTKKGEVASPAQHQNRSGQIVWEAFAEISVVPKGLAPEVQEVDGKLVEASAATLTGGWMSHGARVEYPSLEAIFKGVQYEQVDVLYIAVPLRQLSTHNSGSDADVRARLEEEDPVKKIDSICATTIQVGVYAPIRQGVRGESASRGICFEFYPLMTALNLKQSKMSEIVQYGIGMRTVNVDGRYVTVASKTTGLMESLARADIKAMYGFDQKSGIKVDEDAAKTSKARTYATQDTMFGGNIGLLVDYIETAIDEREMASRVAVTDQTLLMQHEQDQSLIQTLQNDMYRKEAELATARQMIASLKGDAQVHATTVAKFSKVSDAYNVVMAKYAKIKHACSQPASDAQLGDYLRRTVIPQQKLLESQTRQPPTSIPALEADAKTGDSKSRPSAAAAAATATPRGSTSTAAAPAAARTQVPSAGAVRSTAAANYSSAQPQNITAGATAASAMPVDDE